MSVVNISTARTNLSRLVEALQSGAEREIIIARNGRPAAKLRRTRNGTNDTSGKGIITLVVPGAEGEDVEIRLKDRQLVTSAMKSTIQSLPGVAAVESV